MEKESLIKCKHFLFVFLAAGYLSPKDAFPYVRQAGCLDIVALGIASEEEVKETFTEAISVFSRQCTADLF